MNKNEREIMFEGKKLTEADFNDMPIDLSNLLDEILDDFEEGHNPIIDGYETLEHGDFIIRRKKMFDNETLQDAVKTVLEGMTKECFDEQIHQNPLEEAETYIDTYLFQYDYEDNPLTGAEEFEKITGASLEQLKKAVAVAIAKKRLNDVRYQWFDYNFSAEKIAEIEEWLEENTDCRTIKEIIDAYSSIADFARSFAIPYRTAQDWRAGIANPPSWVVEMLDKLAAYEIA